MRKFGLLFVLLLLITALTSAQEDETLSLDISNIRLLHHIPNSTYTVDLSNDGRYLAALNTTYSGHGWQSDDPNLNPSQYEATYLELWDLRADYDLSFYSLPFERFLPPNRTIRLNSRNQLEPLTLKPKVAISSDNNFIAVGFDDEIQLYELDTLRFTDVIYKGDWRDFDWSLEGLELAYIANGQLKILDYENDTEKVYELDNELLLGNIYPMTDRWIVTGYVRGEATSIVFSCEHNRIRCDTLEIDRSLNHKNILFPIILPDNSIAVGDTNNPTQELLSLDFTHASSISHSSNNRYIDEYSFTGYGIWDIQESEFVIDLESDLRHVQWLTEIYFVAINSPDTITRIALYKIGLNQPVQEFEFRNAISVDWAFLTDHLITITGAFPDPLTTFKDPNGDFLVVNLTWVIVYIPIIYV